jgi:glutathione S-transferase
VAIAVDDIKINYITIGEARRMSGLRIVLGAFPIPGPWHEACKGIFYVKGLEYTPVKSSNEAASDLQIGMDGSQSELLEWTAQGSAPVVVWNDERPRSLWNDQLYLAERLAPEPALVPADSEQRVRMFGLANELMGENGLVWSKRHLMVAAPLESLPEGSAEQAFWLYFGKKYGYSEHAAAGAATRIRGIVELLGAQLSAQRARGSRYLIGDRLSAIDIYWATSCAVLDPMPEERCPMWEGFRGSAYGNDDPGIAAALTPQLLDHRDFIYDEHLQLPIVF